MVCWSSFMLTVFLAGAFLFGGAAAGIYALMACFCTTVLCVGVSVMVDAKEVSDGSRG